MSTCVTNAVETQFETVTSDSILTTFSESITIISPVTSTISTSICATRTNGSSIATICTPSVGVTTIEGTTSTSSIPVTITTEVTSVRPTSTVFTTTCATTPIPRPPIISDSSTSSSTPSTVTVTPTSTITSTMTFESSSTRSDGSVFVTQQTSVVTITPPPTQIGDNNGGSSVNIGAIVGGTAGGLAFLALIAVGVYYLIRKSNKPSFEDALGDYDKFAVRPQHHSGGLDFENDSKPGFGPGGGSGQPLLSWNQTGGSGGTSGHLVGQGPGGGHGVNVGQQPYADPNSTFGGPGGNMGAPTGGNGFGPGNPAVNHSIPGANPNFPGYPTHAPPNPHPNFSPVPGVVPLAHHRHTLSEDNSSVRPPSTHISTLPSTYPASSGGGTSSVSSSDPLFQQRPILTVANPNPEASFPGYPRDVKDPQIYLRADTGYEVRSGMSGAPTGGVPRPVVQHQDGGSAVGPSARMSVVASGGSNVAGVGTVGSTGGPESTGGMGAGSNVHPSTLATSVGGSSSAARPQSADASATGASTGAATQPTATRRRSTDKAAMGQPKRRGNDEPPPPPAYEA